MKKQRILILMLVLLCCFFLVFRTLAVGVSSDNYDVPWYARWGGGGPMNSANYTINGTVGQGAIGWTESASYGLGTGFWYGAIMKFKLLYLPLVLRDSM